MPKKPQVGAGGKTKKSGYSSSPVRQNAIKKQSSSNQVKKKK